MKENNEKKKSKKKILIIILFLFAVIAIAGYGVYSYYWTEGTFNTNSAQVEILSFNPTASSFGCNSGATTQEDFLGKGGKLILECGQEGASNTIDENHYDTDGDTTLICRGMLTVCNRGDTQITVEIDENNATTQIINKPTALNITATRPTFLYNPDGIDKDQCSDIEVTTNVVLDGSSPIKVNAPVTDPSFDVVASFSIKAIQAH